MGLIASSTLLFPKHHKFILRWQRKSLPFCTILPCLVALLAAMVVVWAGCLITSLERPLAELLWRLEQCISFMARLSPAFYLWGLLWCALGRQYYRFGRGGYFLMLAVASGTGVGYGFGQILQGLLRRGVRYEHFAEIGTVCCAGVGVGVFYTVLLAALLEREQQAVECRQKA